MQHNLKTVADKLNESQLNFGKIKNTAKVASAFALGASFVGFTHGLDWGIAFGTMYCASSFAASASANILNKTSLSFDFRNAVDNLFYSGLSVPVLFITQQATSLHLLPTLQNFKFSLSETSEEIIKIVVMSLVNAAWNIGQRYYRKTENYQTAAKIESLRAPLGYSLASTFATAGDPLYLALARIGKDAVTFASEYYCRR